MEICIQNLSKTYGAFRALDDVSLQLKSGEIIALLGANGAGKSTLLRCMAAIVAQDKGTVLYDDQELKRDRLDLRRRFFFLPDFPYGLGEMNVIAHISMVLRLYKADGNGVEERVIQLLRDFDMLTLIDSRLSTLSRGQVYKAMFCALAAADPELWMMDEPFASGMDPHGLSAFKRYVREAAQRGRTILYSTQILELARSFSDRACVIHKGKLRAFDAIASLESEAGKDLENLFDSLREEIPPA